MASSTRTRYAKCGDVDIAYQVLGEGPIDVLLFAGWTIPIDCMDDEPSLARFQRRLASFSRLIRFDTRGVSLSKLLYATRNRRVRRVVHGNGGRALTCWGL